MQIYGLTAGGSIIDFAKKLGIPVYAFENRPCACIMHASDVSLEFGPADQNHRPYMSLTGEIIKVKLGDLDGQLDEPSAVWFRDGDGIPSRVIYEFSEEELVNMVRSGMYDGNTMEVPPEFQSGDYTFVYNVSGHVVQHHDKDGNMVPLIYLSVPDSTNKELNQNNCPYHFGLQCYSPEMWAEIQRQDESHDDYVYGKVFTDYAGDRDLTKDASDGVVSEPASEPIVVEFDSMFETAMQNDAQMVAAAGVCNTDQSQAVVHASIPQFQATSDVKDVDDTADRDDMFAEAFASLKSDGVDTVVPTNLDLTLTDDGDDAEFADWIGAEGVESEVDAVKDDESVETEPVAEPESVFVAKDESILEDSDEVVVESESTVTDTLHVDCIETDDVTVPVETEIVMESASEIEPVEAYGDPIAESVTSDVYQTSSEPVRSDAHSVADMSSDRTAGRLGDIANDVPLSLQDVVHMCSDMSPEQAVRFIKQNAYRIDSSVDDDAQYGD